MSTFKLENTGGTELNSRNLFVRTKTDEQFVEDLDSLDELTYVRDTGTSYIIVNVNPAFTFDEVRTAVNPAVVALEQRAALRSDSFTIEHDGKGASSHSYLIYTAIPVDNEFVVELRKNPVFCTVPHRGSHTRVEAEVNPVLGVGAAKKVIRQALKSLVERQN